MSTLGTALKATGVALLASSAVAAGGIGYGGYKLATSVSSTIDNVREKIRNGDLDKDVSAILKTFNVTVETFNSKLKDVDPNILNEALNNANGMASFVSGGSYTNSEGKEVKQSLFTRFLLWIFTK